MLCLCFQADYICRAQMLIAAWHGQNALITAPYHVRYDFEKIRQ
jgi:hypothetical protein